MSITVANLMAQVGADLTQFRLGMNEVDARINQVKVRSESGMRSVAAMRAESARLTGVANMTGIKRTAETAAVAMARLQAPILKKAAQDAQSEVAKAEAALLALGNKKSTTQAKSRSVAEAEVASRKKIATEAEKDYKAADAQVNKLTASVERLGRAEQTARRRSIGLATGAENNERLNSASAAVATAYAERLKQNSNEHRIRSLNTISNVAETGGAVGLAGLGAATMQGADFNQMLLQTAHNTQLSASGVDVMNETVKRLGSTNGGDLKEIAQGFRLMTDYGNNAAQSQMMLTVAMKASVATGSDLITTSELLAKATKEFNLPIESAATTMGIMVETGRRSTLTQEQMVQVGGQLYAVAANLGVSFVDANAALITYTKHGLNASQATVQLRNDINKIISPTAGVKKFLGNFDKKYGTDLAADFSTAGLRAKHMLGIWQDIVAASKKAGVNSADLAVKIFPNQRGTIGAVIATGTGFKDFAKDRAALIKVAGSGTDPIEGMYRQSLGQLNIQIERLKNTATIAASDISNVLTPSITNLLQKIDSGVASFDSLDKQTQATWVKLATGTSVALIVFGAVGKLIVGIAALNTALITLRGAGIVATLGAFGPWGIALAVAAAAVTLIVLKLKELDEKTAITTKELNDANQKQIDAAKAGHDNAAALAQLIGQYNKLRTIISPTHKQLADMKDLLNKISLLSPSLVTGYNAQGQAIGLVGDAALQTAAKVREMSRAMVDAAQKQIDIKAADIAEKNSDRSVDLARLKYSASTGMLPDKDANGGYSWDRPRVSIINKNKNNPYLSEDKDPYMQPFSFGSKLPVMHHGSTAEMSQVNQQIRALSADRAANEAMRVRLVKQGITPFYAAKSTADPYHTRDVPHTPGLDKLAGLGDSAKKPKKDHATHSANTYLDELRKKQYDVVHTGELAANEWEIMSGKLQGMGRHVAEVSRQIVRHTMALELAKKMSEAYRNSALAGHDDVKAGIELIGGQDVWKDISKSQKLNAIKAATDTKGRDAMYDMSEQWNKRNEESLHPVKSAYDEASASVDEVMSKLHRSINDPAWAKYVQNIKSLAVLIDKRAYDKYTKGVDDGFSNSFDTIHASTRGDAAKIKAEQGNWKRDNQEHLDLMTRTQGPETTKVFLESVNTRIANTYNDNKQVEAQKKIDALMESSLRKSKELSTINPFDRWVESLKEYDARTKTFSLDNVVGNAPVSPKDLHDIFDMQQNNSALEVFDTILSDVKKKSEELKQANPFDTWTRSFSMFDKTMNGGRGGYKLPGVNGKPMDISTANIAYNQETQNTLMESAENTLTDLNKQAIALRQSDPFKVWLQSYQIFDKTANGGRGRFITPGANTADRAANEKQLHELYDYQTKIDLMKKASEGLTGVIVGAIDSGYGKGFKGMFERIKEGFNKMLFDMATQFLQSQLLKLLQAQLFGSKGMSMPGAGAQSGGGNGLVSLGSSLLGIAGNFFGGGGGIASAAKSASAGPFTAPVVSFNGRALGGPISAGQTYITGEHGPELITAGASGHVYNARDTRGILSSNGDTHMYNISINTPDAASFHRSSGVVLDEMHRAAMRAHQRTR